MPLRDERKTLLLGKEKSISSKPFFRDWAIFTIMSVQVSFFIFAWIFAGRMMHKTIPLPDVCAAWVQSHPSDTQAIVTLVSTVLALIGSYLLDRAVQHALVHRLSYAPLRLHTMVAWAKLAQHSMSLHFDKHGLSWTLLTLVWATLLGFLTTAWSTLLAPEGVVIYYDFQGIDADLLDPTASSLFDYAAPPQPGLNLTPADASTYDDNFNSATDSAEAFMDAGFLAASAKLHPNNPSASSFISIPNSSYVSNISTGGILPTSDLALSPFSNYSSIGDSLYQGLSRTYSAIQRGFTAEISCRTPAPTDPVITLNLTNSFPLSTDEDNTWTVETFSWSTNCSSEVEYSTFGVTVVVTDTTEPALFMSSVCFNQDFSGPSNQSFLVLLDSGTDDTYASLKQTCQVTPLITTVQTTYDQTGIINIAQPPLNQYPLPDPIDNTGTPILWAPAYVIWTTFVKSQGLTSNMMGDKLLALGGTNYTSVTEDYLRGIVEYHGSFMAQSLTLPLGYGPTVPFNITVHTHSFGWTFHPRTHSLSLAIITLVTALTVAAGGFALKTSIDLSNGVGKSQTQKLRATQTGVFNPTDLMDVLLASSTGDLAKVLSESCDAYHHTRIISKHGNCHRGEEGLMIVLGMTEEGWPALRTVSMSMTGADTNVPRCSSGPHHDGTASGSGRDADNGSGTIISHCDEEMGLEGDVDEDREIDHSSPM